MASRSLPRYSGLQRDVNAFLDDFYYLLGSLLIILTGSMTLGPDIYYSFLGKAWMGWGILRLLIMPFGKRLHFGGLLTIVFLLSLIF